MRRVVLAGLAAALVALSAGATGDAASSSATRWHLVFTSNRDGDYDVYSAGANGRRIGTLTHNRKRDEGVVLSPKATEATP